MVFPTIHNLGDDADDQRRRELGGKGAMLNELASMRYVVPPGFVIATNAFDYYLDSIPGLRYSLADLNTAMLMDSKRTALEITNSIHDRLMTSPIPDELISLFDDAFQRSGLSTAAVRSSAVAEDGLSKNFAGIFDSLLNVGRTSFPTAVRHVFASAVSNRVLAYQPRCLSHPEFAVVVHAMVNADISGVCYTRATADRADEQLRIEAVFGLGEPLLAGELVPDSYFVDRLTTRVKAMGRVQPRKLVLPDSADTPPEWVEIDEACQLQTKLNDDQCQEVARLALDLEKLFEMPCDIEWAIAQRRLFVLQCRPLTQCSDEPRQVIS